MNDNDLQKLDKANKAIKSNPKDADAYVDRADVYACNGNNTQAIADFNMAISIGFSSNNALGSAYIGLGYIYKDMGDLEKAIEYISKAVALVPGQWDFVLQQVMPGGFYNR